jgi:hypothetical protein
MLASIAEAAAATELSALTVAQDRQRGHGRYSDNIRN